MNLYDTIFGVWRCRECKMEVKDKYTECLECKE